MGRNQRRKPWSATLPGGREVAGILPDCLLTRKALELVHGGRIKDVKTALAEAEDNVLRLCVTKIGDRDVGYEDLRHGAIDRHLAPSEKELVKTLFRHLRNPTELELQWLEESLQTSKKGDSWRWSGRLLTGQALERWYEVDDKLSEARTLAKGLKEQTEDLDEGAEDELFVELNDVRDEIRRLEAELERIDSEEIVEIKGILQNSKLLRRCMEQVPDELQKLGPAIAQKEISENMARNCLREINGERVDYEDLRETGLDEWLDTKEQNLVIYALMKLGHPDDQEVDDFLSTVEVG